MSKSRKRKRESSTDDYDVYITCRVCNHKMIARLLPEGDECIYCFGDRECFMKSCDFCINRRLSK